MNGKTAVRIAYGGPDVDSGAMDVKELAPALLAFGELIEESNKLINGQESKVKVLVKSDFRKGSFDVGFEMVHNLCDQIKLITGSLQEVSIEQITIYLGLAAGASQFLGFNLIDLIKKVRGRKAKKVTAIENNMIRLEFEEEIKETIDVHKDIVNLYRSISVRSKVDQVLKPLEREGIDFFQVRANDAERKPITEVTKSEQPLFVAPEISEAPEAAIKELESTRHAVFKIVGISFEEQLKWRLDDGDTRIYATILDDDFLARIDNREYSFAKGDTLEVELRTKQTVSSKGIKTEHEVIKVVRLYKKPEQISLI